MISLLDPIVRLNLLKEYIYRRVDRYPLPTAGFECFLHHRYGYLIPGTAAYIKRIATHCFYCNRVFDNSSKNFKATVDHYLPKSLGETEKFVICCADCNNRKGNISPIALVEKMTKAHLRGGHVWGHHGKKLKYIAMQLQRITNDILFDTGPRTYFFKR